MSSDRFAACSLLGLLGCIGGSNEDGLRQGTDAECDALFDEVEEYYDIKNRHGDQEADEMCASIQREFSGIQCSRTYYEQRNGEEPIEVKITHKVDQKFCRRLAAEELSDIGLGDGSGELISDKDNSVLRDDDALLNDSHSAR